METRLTGAPDTATLLRRGLLLLAGLGIAGTAIELVFLRHWGTAAAMVVWPAMAILAIGLGLLVRWPSPRIVQGVRVLAVVAAVVGLVGVGIHVAENLTAGPLDRDYAATWDSMSVVAQWFAAITGGVGPAPALAPAAISEVALALLLGTVSHPALVGRVADPGIGG